MYWRHIKGNQVPILYSTKYLRSINFVIFVMNQQITKNITHENPINTHSHKINAQKFVSQNFVYYKKVAESRNQITLNIWSYNYGTYCIISTCVPDCLELQGLGQVGNIVVSRNQTHLPTERIWWIDCITYVLYHQKLVIWKSSGNA